MRERPDSKMKRAKKEEIKEMRNKKYNYMSKSKLDEKTKERFFGPLYYKTYQEKLKKLEHEKRGEINELS